MGLACIPTLVWSVMVSVSHIRCLGMERSPIHVHVEKCTVASFAPFLSFPVLGGPIGREAGSTGMGETW